MDFILHTGNRKCVAELHSDSIEIREVQDALDIMADAGQLGARALIICEHHVLPDFFNLSSGIAGEILQKFSNYQMKLAIVGDFTKYSSKSLRDFIFESNKRGWIRFVPSVEDAKAVFLK